MGGWFHSGLCAVLAHSAWESLALTRHLGHLRNCIHFIPKIGRINLAHVIFHYENLKVFLE